MLQPEACYSRGAFGGRKRHVFVNYALGIWYTRRENIGVQLGREQERVSWSMKDGIEVNKLTISALPRPMDFPPGGNLHVRCVTRIMHYTL